MDRLAGDSNEGIRIEVAKNSNTPTETLNGLSKDEGWQVRAYVAKNPNTPTETLDRLSRDPEEAIRIAVAKNPSAPTETLNGLSKDEDKWAREYAVENIGVRETAAYNRYLAECREAGMEKQDLAVEVYRAMPQTVGNYREYESAVDRAYDGYMRATGGEGRDVGELAKAAESAAREMKDTGLPAQTRENGISREAARRDAAGVPALVKTEAARGHENGHDDGRDQEQGEDHGRGYGHEESHEHEQSDAMTMSR